MGGPIILPPASPADDATFGRACPTKLSLPEWARIMGIDPLHFQGVAVGEGLNGRGPSCGSPWFQHDWQDSERVSREQLACAIREAEDEIERWLGYRLLPSWEVDEWRPTIRPTRRAFVNLSSTDVRGYQQALRADWGYFITGGIEKRTFLDDPSIAWTDADGDGYEETGTVTVAVTDEAACDIRIFYPGKSAAPEWEIRPARVAIAAGTATITFRRELCVLFEEQERYPVSEASGPLVIDGTDDTKFLDTVDVYTLTNDPATQATFLWEPTGDCGCSGGDCARCSYATQSGCLLLRGDPRGSFVAYSAGSYAADTNTFSSDAWAVGRQPDTVRLFYRAGYRDRTRTCPEKEIDRDLARIVAIYAASLLSRPVCACNQQAISRWQNDLAAVGGADELEVYTGGGGGISQDDLGNPLGTTAGAMWAWKRLGRGDRAIGRAIIA